jgi:Xaa-Pro aminopeptidase
MNTSENKTPKSEIDKRIENLKSRLKETRTDAALILQNTDLFYFSGTIQQSHLYVPAEGDPILMVRKSMERAVAESPLERIVSLSSPRQIPDILRRNGYELPACLGMELDILPANMYFMFQGIFESAEITDISHQIRLTRAVKSPYELGLIRKAAQFSDQLAGCVKELLREGMTQIELAGKIEAQARKMGHQGIVRMRLWGSELFYGHLLAGPSAALPSFLASPTGGPGVGPAVAQGPGLIPINPHEPVLVDYCFVYQGYISDHSRIFSLGELPDDLLKGHEAMLDIQSVMKKTAKPGVKAGEVYEIAVERAGELGYAENFMGVGDQRIRFVGHGVGLELDEYPFIAKGQNLELQNGMIMALEPKLIFPGKGVVGIENTHQVTDDGLEQLGRFEEGVVVV